MKKYLDYCYYRIARFYKFFEDFRYVEIAGIILFAGLSSFMLIIVDSIYHQFNLLYTENEIKVVVSCFLLISLFYSSEEKYKKLEEQYANEDNKSMKGWLVFIFLLVIYSSYFIFLFLYRT